MRKPLSLKPLDVAVAIRLAQVPNAKYDVLAKDLLLSTSTVHAAVQRLEAAQLIIRGTRAVNRLRLLEFLRTGVRYAFPAVLGTETRGVATAHTAPPMAGRIVAVDPVVWPATHGIGRGAALPPLLPRAADLPQHRSDLYEALTLVDALRVGRARERNLAAGELAERLARVPAAV